MHSIIHSFMHSIIHSFTVAQDDKVERRVLLRERRECAEVEPAQGRRGGHVSSGGSSAAGGRCTIARQAQCSARAGAAAEPSRFKRGRRREKQATREAGELERGGTRRGKHRVRQRAEVLARREFGWSEQRARAGRH